jgi:hypothetical protein
MPSLFSQSPSYEEKNNTPAKESIEKYEILTEYTEASNEAFHVFFTYKKRPSQEELEQAFEFRKSLEFHVKNNTGGDRKLLEDLLTKFKHYQATLQISEAEYLEYKTARQEELYDIV